MCEAEFPAVDVTHELFVDHVNSHFTCEGAPDTLHNYEVVDEAEASMLPAYYSHHSIKRTVLLNVLVWNFSKNLY